jgi:enoyl-CoA hydratase/carnithine racemase
MAAINTRAVSISPRILTEARDGVALLRINRPEKRNAFDTPTYDALATALRTAADDDAVRVTVVTGAGQAFSAGRISPRWERSPRAVRAATSTAFHT